MGGRGGGGGRSQLIILPDPSGGVHKTGVFFVIGDLTNTGSGRKLYRVSNNRK